MIVGLGGAPAVVITRSRSNGCACGELAIDTRTVGDPSRWVIPCSSKSRQMRSARTIRGHTWVPPTPVTAHGVHHPLQWNIGNVHRYTLAGSNREWMISPSEFR